MLPSSDRVGFIKLVFKQQYYQVTKAVIKLQKFGNWLLFKEQ
jgi:hypothetical protein